MVRGLLLIGGMSGGRRVLPGPLRWVVERGGGAGARKVRVREGGGREWARERRQGLAWKRFLKRARQYARQRLGLVRWRGVEDGVPPDGYDAESVAMEAVMVAGREREEAGKGWRRDWRRVAREIIRIVDQLRHRQEVSRMSSEPDLGWMKLNDEEMEREVKEVPDAGKKPGDELAEWERVNAFKKYLGPDDAARELVDCYCGNVTSPREIVKLTGLTARAIVNARKRVRRRWREFRGLWQEDLGQES